MKLITQTCTYCLISLTLLFAFLRQVFGVGCFVCTSINGSEPDCEDTFNNTGRFYRPDCKAGRKQRSGIFPATDCIKMKAEYTDGTSIIVRQCVVDAGDINSETEIGRSNHCGLINTIRYDDRSMHGCLLSCNTNGCNDAPPQHTRLGITTLLLTALSIWMHYASWLYWV